MQAELIKKCLMNDLTAKFFCLFYEYLCLVLFFSTEGGWNVRPTRKQVNSLKKIILHQK